MARITTVEITTIEVTMEETTLMETRGVVITTTTRMMVAMVAGAEEVALEITNEVGVAATSITTKAMATISSEAIKEETPALDSRTLLVLNTRIKTIRILGTIAEIT